MNIKIPTGVLFISRNGNRPVCILVDLYQFMKQFKYIELRSYVFQKEKKLTLSKMVQFQMNIYDYVLSDYLQVSGSPFLFFFVAISGVNQMYKEARQG